MSAYSSGQFKQDMPPSGGYQDINYKRIPAQKLVGNRGLFAAACVMTAYGYFYYSNRRNYLRKMIADWYDHLIAIEPLWNAEQDRAFLRQLRHNRNVERDLMKNVPDWKVGTLWGKPVYNTVPKNALPNVSIFEFYAHRGITDSRDTCQPNWDVGLEDNEMDSI